MAVKTIKSTTKETTVVPDVPAVAAYNAEHIRTVEDMDAVRNRPTEFFPDQEIMGLRHAAKEITDNGLDEINLLGSSARMDATIVRDLQKMTYVLIIQDTGRGIPLEPNAKGIPVFIAAATQLHTSGKYDQNAYATSGGSFGLGMKGAAGTSEKFRVDSYRPNGTGTLLVERGKFDKKPNISMTPNTHTGVTVVFRPDSEIFTSIDAFTEGAYGLVIDLFRQYVCFRHYNLTFRVADMPFPDNYWKAPLHKAEAILKDVLSKANIVFDSASHDADEWIRKHWGLSRHFTWRGVLRRPTVDQVGPLMDWIVKVFYVKGDRQGSTFGLVNNVPIHGLNNDNLSVPYKVIQTSLGSRITDPAVKRFFMEVYKTPLFLAVDIKFRGARFGGTTKDTYRDPVFRKVMESELESYIQSPEGKLIIDTLYESMAEEIQARYEESLNVKVVQKDRGRLDARLINPSKFDDLGTVTRDAELFLVEGDSAKPRRNLDQAVYRMGGKPLNLVKLASSKTRTQLIEIAMRNPVYHDVFTIIGYDPRRPNIDQLNFKRALIMSDGDSHGRHIAAIFLGSCQLIAPDLVASGFFGIAASPYYEVKSARDTRKSMFIRDQEDIVQWNTEMLYEPYFDIVIHYFRNVLPEITLAGRTYADFAEIVNRVGIAFDNLSEEMSVHPLILEGLAKCTGYLNAQNMNTEHIRETLGADRVSYDIRSNTLTVTIGSDEIVPLHLVAERITDEVLPLLRAIRWMSWIPLFSTRKTPTYKRTPMTLYQIYLIFQKVPSLTTVETVKGVGGMEPDQAFRACVDPRYRKTFTVYNAGDVNVIMSLLGSDSESRKQLKAAAVVNDSMFG